jgi:cyanate permease
VLGFLPTILMETEGFELSAASSLGAAAIGVNVVGALGGGWLMHRGAQRWVLMAVTAAVMGLSAVGIYRTDLPIEIRYALCLVLSAIGGIIPAAVFAGMPHHAPAPNLVATTSGLVMQGSNLGQAIGPPAVAALAVATGSWAWSPLVLLALATACALFALGLRRLEER